MPGGSFTLTEHVEVPEDCEVVASHRLAYEAPPLAKWFDHFHRLKAKDTLRVVNKVVCEVPRPEVEPVAIRLVKLWFDTDGQRVGAPEGDWSVSLDSAVIDAEQPQAAWASVSGSSYTVTESSLPAGWEEVSCFGAGLDLPDLDPGYLEASGKGTHDVTGKGTHAVCNRAVVEVAPVVIEEVVEVEVVEVREVAAVEVREVAAVEVLPVTGGSLLALVLSGLGTLLLGTGIVGRFGRRR